MFMLLAFNLPAFAAGTAASPISIDVATVNVGGSGYTYTAGTPGVITITENGYYTLTGSTTDNRVVVASGLFDVNITLAGVFIDRSAELSNTDDNCAFLMAGAKVNMTLTDTNTLKSGSSYAGLQAPAGSVLTIDGAGELTASSPLGAGIGGGYGSDGGTITINGGTVKAYGGNTGAGIGSNNSSSGGTITINGGTVEAIGGSTGAGLGGGSGSDGGTITINGGTVLAIGGSTGAGIGGGDDGNGGTITISGGSITATGGGSNNGGGAGIGGGRGSDSGTITITGNANVVANGGGGGGAGVGGGGGGISGDGGGVGTITIDNTGTYNPIGGASIDNSGKGASNGNGGGNGIDGAEVPPGTNVITHTATITQTIGGTIDARPIGIDLTQIPEGANQSFVIVPDSGYVIVDVAVDGASVGAVRNWTIPHITADTTITATFKRLITNVDITVTAPVVGATPDTAIVACDANTTCSTVTWTPSNNPFLGGTSYTATVTLTANVTDIFDPALTATINGQTATVTHNADGTVTLSYQFAPTDGGGLSAQSIPALNPAMLALLTLTLLVLAKAALTNAARRQKRHRI